MRRSSSHVSKNEEIRTIREPFFKRDLMELDWISGNPTIPRLEDQDIDYPRMRRIYKPSDAIQATMRADARLRSTPFPGESDGR